jgi:hypothetical protein
MRNQAGSSWVKKAVIFSLSTTLAGMISGFVLGWVGSLARLDIRLAFASLVSLTGIIIAILELSGRRLHLLQCDRETPQSWVHKGPIQWAIQNGLALGSGFANRIGFWLWYSIPLGAFLVGSPVLGACLYGIYGLVRGTIVWALIYGPAKKYGEELAERLIGYNKIARLITTGQLLFLGIVVAIVIGL